MGLVRVLTLAILATLVLPTAGSAVEKTTKWFTIDVMAPNNGTPPLFLTNTSQGVKLERYRSGDPTQHWTYVHVYYPTAPPVTGTWPGEASLNCALSGCPFAEPEGLRKFVNRASGACMAFRDGGGQGQTTTVPCSQLDAEIAKQVWYWTFGVTSVSLYGPPRDYTELWGRYQGQGRCLESVHAGPLTAGTAVQPGVCGPIGATPWYQKFRFLEAASVTCQRDFDWQLCFAQ